MDVCNHGNPTFGPCVWCEQERTQERLSKLERKAAPDPRDAEIARLTAEVERLSALLATRTAERDNERNWARTMEHERNHLQDVALPDAESRATAAESALADTRGVIDSLRLACEQAVAARKEAEAALATERGRVAGVRAILDEVLPRKAFYSGKKIIAYYRGLRTRALAALAAAPDAGSDPLREAVVATVTAWQTSMVYPHSAGVPDRVRVEVPLTVLGGMERLRQLVGVPTPDAAVEAAMEEGDGR